MEDRRFYVITKDGKTVEADTKAGAYEAWESFGRSGVKVEQHQYWKSSSGEQHRTVYDVSKLAKRINKRTGEKTYVFHLDNGKDEVISNG